MGGTNLAKFLKLGACVWFLNKLVGRNIDDESVHGDSFDGDGSSWERVYSRYDTQDDFRQQQAQADPDPPAAKSFDPFEVLGVDHGASQEEIKRQWREMCKKYHPDKTACLGVELQELAHEKMKQINDAYEMLKAA